MLAPLTEISPEMSIDRIWDFLQRLSPLARSCLLAELERLEVSGVDMPGSADIQAKLRAEFRKDGSSQNRTRSIIVSATSGFS